MRDYELLLVIRPSLDNAAAIELSKQVGELLQNNEGAVTGTNMWGRRKLAYPIDNQIEATYILLKCQMNPAKLTDIEFNLKLNESLLRYMIVRDHTPAVADVKDTSDSEPATETTSTETEAENTPSNDDTSDTPPSEEEAASEEAPANNEASAPEETEGSDA
ncbi:MAG: 30S ribosomal protein S6 [Chloroflexota bacterium]